MINNVSLTGRLTKDLELSYTQSGLPVGSFTLAVNRQYKKDGQPDADFINCVAWKKTAENLSQYTHKGSLIGIEGRIQTHSYDNQQGQKVYVTEVVVEHFAFLEPKNNQAESTTEPQTWVPKAEADAQAQRAPQPQQNSSQRIVSDSELPF